MAKKLTDSPSHGPGPGSYQENHRLKDNWVKGVMVGRSARFKGISNTSRNSQNTSKSPFGYDMEASYEKTRENSPAFGFPTEIRDIDRKRMSTPGPGEYSIDEIVGKQDIKVGIGSARRSLDNSIEYNGRAPCPTNYSPNHN